MVVKEGSGAGVELMEGVSYTKKLKLSALNDKSGDAEKFKLASWRSIEPLNGVDMASRGRRYSRTRSHAGALGPRASAVLWRGRTRRLYACRIYMVCQTQKSNTARERVAILVKLL